VPRRWSVSLGHPALDRQQFQTECFQQLAADGATLAATTYASAAAAAAASTAAASTAAATTAAASTAAASTAAARTGMIREATSLLNREMNNETSYIMAAVMRVKPARGGSNAGGCEPAPAP
jgi:hypothetical protein